MKLTRFIILFLLIFILISCSNDKEIPTLTIELPVIETVDKITPPSPVSPIPTFENLERPEETYPMTNKTPTPLLQGYPVPSPSQTQSQPYPIPDPLGEGRINPFNLDRPIFSGDIVITGSGPAGVPIVIKDITYAGPVLAFGIIDKNGNFELKTNQPLQKGHRIGISLGEISGTEWQTEDFSNPLFFGIGALNVPQVDFFFDTCMVTDKD